MWVRLQKAGGWLMMVQGAAHATLGTPMVFDAVTQDAIWFAGSGLAMVFLGLLNVGPWDGASPGHRRRVIAANTIWLLLMAGLLSTSRSARVIVALMLAASCLAGSLLRRPRPGRA